MVIVTLLIGMAGAAVVAGWHYAFRRKEVLDVDETGKKLVSSVDPSLAISAKPVLTEDERLDLKSVFLGSQDFKWMITGWTDGDKNDTEFKNNEKAAQEHRDLTFYMLECVIRFGEEYGYTIVARDQETGDYRGSLLMVPPYSNAQTFNLHFVRSFVPLGYPVYGKLSDPAASERASSWTDLISKAHCDVMDGFKKSHWYVPVLGVSESAQRKGVGKTLMNAAKEIAGDLPLYLDCHDGNVRYYECMGFVNEKKVLVEPKEEGKETLITNCMVYYPDGK